MTSYTEAYISRCMNNSEKPDVKFVEFMDKVEKLVMDTLYVRLLDLPDECYHDMFDNNFTPNEVFFIISESFFS